MNEHSKTVPIEAKHLSACVECKLIMNDAQWRDHDITCPNCKKENPECTSRFSGMISLIHPANSWVAKYNQGSKRIPGIYAIHVFSDQDVQRSGH